MHMPGTRMFCLLLMTLWPSVAGARVVINEIFYHAPNDIDDLEYVELHNSGGDNVVNWASPPLSPDRTKPAGTPGKVNANYSEELPPIISKVTATPDQPAANQALKVEASVRAAEGLAGAKLLYRVAGPGFEK